MSAPLPPISVFSLPSPVRRYGEVRSDKAFDTDVGNRLPRRRPCPCRIPGLRPRPRRRSLSGRNPVPVPPSILSAPAPAWMWSSPAPAAIVVPGGFKNGASIGSPVTGSLTVIPASSGHVLDAEVRRDQPRTWTSRRRTKGRAARGRKNSSLKPPSLASAAVDGSLQVSSSSKEKCNWLAGSRDGLAGLVGGRPSASRSCPGRS